MKYRHNTQIRSGWWGPASTVPLRSSKRDAHAWQRYRCRCGCVSSCPFRTTASLSHPGQRTPSGQRCWRTKAKHFASSSRDARLTGSTGAIAEFWRWPEGSGDGGLGLGGRRVGGDLDPVGESDTLNELGQLVVAIKPAPAFLGGIDQLEHHRERRLVRQAALRTDCAVPDGGKGALDRVRGPQVFPVFGGKIVEGEQSMAILCQARGGLVVFELVGCHEGVERSRGVLAGLGHPDFL